MKRLLLFVSTILLTSLSLEASHIKAGEIIVRDNPSVPYNFTFDFILYYESENITTDPTVSKIDVSSILVSMGDFTQKRINLLELRNINGTTAKGVYRTTHTYSGAGTFIVSFSENFRIANILNLGAPRSSDVPLHIYAQIDLNRVNASPILTLPPLDFANQGEIFTHNPGAYDPNGDSLSFELVTPREGVNNDVPNYTSPADPKFGGQSNNGGPASLTIDAKTGQITWNTPGQRGFYNIAIKITEFRRGSEIGHIIRDMQIEVKEHNNRAPVVSSPDEVCLEALKTTAVDFMVTDPDLGDRFNIYKYGDISLNPDLIFPPNSNEILNADNPYSGKISWTPSCAQVREQPYLILIKAEEYNLNPQIKLSNIKTISMKVRGPRPILKTVEETVNKTVKLTWEPYVCGNAESLRVYRAECDGTFMFDPCASAKVISNNYKQIGTIDAKATEFIDTNNGLPFKSAIKYFYTVIAFFPASPRGVSYEATPISITFNSKNVLINSVDVVSQNVIKLTWNNPDLSGTTPNYGYEILRSTDNVTFNSIFKKIDLSTLSDVEYTDNSVDLSTNNYYYQIRHFANNDFNTAAGVSASASNIILNYKPLVASAQITWSGALPYNIFKVKIYDVKAQTYVDSVTNESSYTVENLKSCVDYEYLVTTYQKYCVTAGDTFYTSSSYKIKVSPLADKALKLNLNLKQSSCYVVPCEELIAEASDTLMWPDFRRNDACADVLGYNIYFKSILETDFIKIASLPASDTSFKSIQNISRVGCYYIRPIIKDVNGQEKEGESSNTVCVNNDCYCFKLPNIITPNGDNINDLLIPLRYPRYIKSVKCTIYNRWGTKVYETSDPDIKWDAKNVDAGVYYYVADLSKYSLDGHDKEEIKGYVTVVK